ncbi:MAG: formylglycine-generating enzyme family protein [Prevotellaceae bacterium]|jgi:formylglycine-generating enzyme required for sulfatase activity|nr:formylglycine-generating enzyme family protein [Prevotellaceae bacterium]
MKKNMIFLCALLLVGAASMMAAGAQTKPTLAVFVVGISDNTLATTLTTALGTNLTSGGRYVLTTVNTSGKLAELKAAYTAGGGGSIDRNALAVWGHKEGIGAICLVVDDVKSNDHLFSAQLIDTKDSKLDGHGSYTRTSVAAGDVARVALALAKQLEGAGRKHATASAKNGDLNIELVRVEGGTFTMGCTAEQPNCDAIEKPTHNVTLSSFSIGKYEITQAQWKAVMTGVAGTTATDVGEIYYRKGANCGNMPCDDQRPAENMDWFEAVTFCNELSKKLGLEAAYDITGTGTSKTVALTGKKGYRLPTEAEWEYAARGCKGDGSASNAVCENLQYSGSNDPNEVAWCKENSSATTHPVGQRKPNALGIYDMNGNVREWVYDWSGNYSNVAATNPTGPVSGSSNRVLRGGHIERVPPQWIHISSRYIYNAPSYRYNLNGFRVALP